jgi:hypothetical protein
VEKQNNDEVVIIDMISNEDNFDENDEENEGEPLNMVEVFIIIL